MKGLKIRSAGPTFAEMWQAAGASIVSVPSNEVYNALQTGVADATDTSSGSFVSFRIYEQVKCMTAPGENALWFMYEPVLMSKKSFDRLNKQQQDVLMQGRQKSARLLREGDQGSRRRDGQGIQGAQRRGRHADPRRVQPMARRSRSRALMRISPRKYRTARS